MSEQPDALLAAIDQLERALEQFRAAYAAWLAGDGEDEALASLLAEAERRLDGAREALGRVEDSLRA